MPITPDPEHFLIREQDGLRLITPKSKEVVLVLLSSPPVLSHTVIRPCKQQQIVHIPDIAQPMQATLYYSG